MIGRLHGKLVSKHPPHLLLDVNGVGYEIEAPMSTFYELPEVGEQVTLLTHLVVREDAQLLFGFATGAERSLFRALIKVSGVGAKMAVTILSGTSAEGFARCVREEDAAALTRLPGVGKKTAERLIIEMRDKLDASGETRSAAGELLGSTEPGSASDEAFSALVALGYKPAEATRMIKSVQTDNVSSEAIIRAALQAAAKRG